ncbi:type VII secretion protein EccE [Mycobacterium sp.]|uniref:type VII secretion protein EccE n=1 Tax=Mycobacterium sp. TaxID=1785 RepID=UPI0031CE35BB
MKAQRRFGLAVSWPRVTAVFLIDVAVLAVASHCPDTWQTHHIAWWAGVGIAVLITVAALLSYRGIPVTSAPVARLRNWYTDPAAMLAGCTPAIDHRRRFGRDVVGVREYRGQLVAVIAVEGPVGVPSGRHRERPAPAVGLPVGTIASALRQFDVRLDGIDIVAVEARRVDSGVAAAVRDDFGKHGDASAGHQRRVWLVLRMDPQRNVAATAARDSVASTVAAAAERLADDLDGPRCTARTLNADQIADVDEAVLAGLDPASIAPYWRHLKHPGGFVTSFWVSPADITAETLEQLWEPDTDATVVTLRLEARRGGADVSVWVRYHSRERLPKELCRGLNRLAGRQLTAVAASLPAPTSGPRLVMPRRPLRADEHLEMPLGTAPHDVAVAGRHR